PSASRRESRWRAPGDGHDDGEGTDGEDRDHGGHAAVAAQPVRYRVEPATRRGEYAEHEQTDELGPLFEVELGVPRGTERVPDSRQEGRGGDGRGQRQQ